MKKYLLTKNLHLVLFSFFIFSSFGSFSCSVPKSGISLFYLFDTSGSFHKDALPSSVNLAEKLFFEISNQESVFASMPQIHQVGTIDNQSVQIGNMCNIEVQKKTLDWDKNVKKNIDTKKENPTIRNCLDQIRNIKRSQYTDIDGALLTASQSLQTAGLYGKGIIIFSDLHEDVPSPKSFNYDLTGISVVIVYEVSKQQIREPGLFEQDKDSMIKRLKDHGVKTENIMFRNLKSLDTSPNEIVSFLRKSFRNG